MTLRSHRIGEGVTDGSLHRGALCGCGAEGSGESEGWPNGEGSSEGPGRAKRPGHPAHHSLFAVQGKTQIETETERKRAHKVVTPEHP